MTARHQRAVENLVRNGAKLIYPRDNGRVLSDARHAQTLYGVLCTALRSTSPENGSRSCLSSTYCVTFRLCTVRGFPRNTRERIVPAAAMAARKDFANFALG